MSDNNTYATGGIGFFTFITIILIILKLCGAITWDWWICLFAPLIIQIILIVVVLCGVLIVAFLDFLYSEQNKEKDKWLK